MKIVGLWILLLALAASAAAWGNDNSKRVQLKDVNVLTLYHGKMTKGRRSSPLPQLECVNKGTAPCSAFQPKVVQCINRGSDGYDIQWECKTDMDNAFRFGEIEVSCEGYDYPDDPYVLHGSCGLKYSLDYTKEGLDQKKHHNYYGDDDDYSSNYHHSSYKEKKSKSTSGSIIADLIVYIAMGLIVYALYKTCTNRHYEGQPAYSSTDEDYPSGGGGGGYGWFGGGQAPPYSSGYGYNDTCRNRNTGYRGTGGGGFWTGAATGGLLGYMFGNRQNGWWGGNWGWGGGNGGWRSGHTASERSFRSSPSPSSSGTRTASGFGGTSRR